MQKLLKSNQEVTNSIQKIFDVFVASETQIRPHFVLTGSSGSGKSFTIQQLAAELDINYIEVNAAQLTKEGYSGSSLSKVLTPLGDYANLPTICFVDEFDKLFITGNSNNTRADDLTTGIQNEFLKILESPTTTVIGQYGHYDEVQCDNVLFIFAGAFNGISDINLDRLRDFGLKTEFLGRVPLVFNFDKPTKEEMLNFVENSFLIEQYSLLSPTIKKSQAINDISRAVIEEYEKNTLGVRMINGLVHQYYINGGKLPKKAQKQTTFQKTIDLTK